MHELDIFEKALEIEDSIERESFIRSVCAGNDELHQRVEQLLSASKHTDSFMESPVLLIDSETELPDISIGSTIGPYTLQKKIGEGGMGVVFVAKQTNPIDRCVALKVVKPWMNCQKIVERFETERRTLALMDHPNIAKVIDAGTTPSGIPFFVMELVIGIRIDKYCDKNELTLIQRIEIFIDVCRAVQHAHQKGIIHRDLKPSNILIANHEGIPNVKVIDFGVAKAISTSLVSNSNSTQFGFLVGTFEYMSPEQAGINHQDVDTRSDIYSLGAVLYELLCGQTPYDKERVRSARLNELLTMISTEEPLAPSKTFLQSDEQQVIARRRKTNPSKLASQLQGDLDNIISKSLAKDRSRRYVSTDALVMDLQRYLRNEPVSAGPPSVVYLMRKFCQRNKSLLMFLIVSAVLLITGTVISTKFAIKASMAEKLAKSYLSDANENLEKAKQAVTEANEARSNAEKALADLKLSQQIVNEHRQFIVQLAKSPFTGENTDWSAINGPGGLNDKGRELAIQADGKVVVVGVLPKSVKQHSQDLLVARYNVDGTIDKTFNSSGYNVADFGKLWRDIGTNVAIQRDGKIIAAGGGVDHGDPERPFHLIAARFDGEGRLEKMFSCLPFNRSNASDILSLPDGKILLLSTVRNRPQTQDIMLTRLNSDFSLDKEFGNEGHVIHDFQNGPNSGWEMARQSDGKIVVVGGAQGQAYVARFNGDGSLDIDYAMKGETRISLSDTGKSNLNDIVLDEEDNAFVSGWSEVEGGSKCEITVLNLDRNGNLNPEFGDNGVFRYSKSDEEDRAEAIALDQFGKLVVVGKSGPSPIALRVNQDGSLDKSFGYRGSILFGGDQTISQLNSVVIDAKNRPVFVGGIIFGQSNVWLIRLNSM